MSPSTAFLSLPEAHAQVVRARSERWRVLSTVVRTLGTILMVVGVTVVACLFPFLFGRRATAATRGQAADGTQGLG